MEAELTMGLDKKTLNILLIEDSFVFFQLVKQFTSNDKDYKYNIEIAGFLEEGLTYLKEADFDIILLDLGLPDSAGIETFIKVKKNAPGIPIIVLTSDSNENIVKIIMREGAKDYFYKEEINGLALCKAITKAVEGGNPSN